MSTGPMDPGPVRTKPAPAGPARTKAAGSGLRTQPDTGGRGRGGNRGAEQEAAQQAMALLMSLAVPVAEPAEASRAQAEMVTPGQAATGRGAGGPAAAGRAAEETPPLPELPSLPALPDRRVRAAPGIRHVLPAVVPPPRRPDPGHATHGVAAAPPAWTRLGTASHWPVAVILAAQAALSVRLIWRAGAAPAEAAYLNSWRLDPGHWLPGAAGLTAGRLLSLALMLAATTLLHGTTRRLYDRRSAFFAAALFAGLAGTSFLGAFASSDALSVALLAAAAWLGIQAACRRGTAQAGLAAAAGALLALAIATGYRAGLAGPAGLGLTTLAVWRTSGRRAAAQAGAVTGAGLAGALGALVLATGPARGIPATTVLRAWFATPAAGPSGSAAAAGAGSPEGAGWPASLLTGGGQWLVVLALLAVAGALIKISARQGWPVSAMSALLAAAALGIPAEPVRAAAGPWLAVPSCCGAWLGCVIGGYGVASLARAVPRAKSAAAFGVGLGFVVLAAVPGVGWAGQQVSWPRAAPVVDRVEALLDGHAGPVLTDSTGDLLRLYLGASLARRVLVQADIAPAAPSASTGPDARATGAGTRPGTGLAGPGVVRQCDLAACRHAIARHRFAVIVLSLWHAGPASYQLQRAIVLAGYRRLATVASSAGGAAPGSSDGPWNIWVRVARP